MTLLSSRTLAIGLLISAISIYGLFYYSSSSLKMHPEARLPFMDYCAYYNYPVESHRVTTPDGYILTLFRIQAKYSKIKSGLQPVLLQHGLLDSSDTWIINDESKAPAFFLANRGYDVWLGNNRGKQKKNEFNCI